MKAVDIEFAKANQDQLDVILGMLGVEDESDLESAAAELAEMLDQPENADVLKHTTAFLSNALSLKKMLRQAVAKSADEPEPFTPEGVRAFAKRFGDTVEHVHEQQARIRQDIDEIQAMQKGRTMTSDGLRKAADDASIYDHARRFAENQAKIDEDRMPKTVYDLLSNWVVKEMNRVHGGNLRGPLVEDFHPMFPLVYDVARLIRGSEHDPNGERFEPLLSKAADVPSLAHIIRLAMTGDLGE